MGKVVVVSGRGRVSRPAGWLTGHPGRRTDRANACHMGMTGANARRGHERAILVHRLRLFSACRRGMVRRRTDRAPHHRRRAPRGESAFSIPCVLNCGAP
ncbi:hypothetical protein EMIT0158MI4_110120 [Burkholderia ambifaria]